MKKKVEDSKQGSASEGARIGMFRSLVDDRAVRRGMGLLAFFSIVLGDLRAQFVPVRPLITCQPGDVTVGEGARVSLKVCAESFLNMRYQWRRDGVKIEGATDPELVLDSMSLDQAGEYSVEVSNNVGKSLSEIAAVRLTGRPVILRAGQDQSVSLGVDVVLSVFSSGTSPLEYQWFRNGEAIDGANESRLVIGVEETVNDELMLQFSGGVEATVNLGGESVVSIGDYSVEVQNALGSESSRSASVEVDTTFTKQVGTELTSDEGAESSGVWADYDSDGDLDVFIPSLESGPNALYQNNGDLTWTRVVDGPIATDEADSVSGAWGDYDGDGLLDLIVSNSDAANFLYRNIGDGRFEKQEGLTITDEEGIKSKPSWADFDGDGNLDLFFARGNVGAPQRNAAFLNLGAEGFAPLEMSALLDDELPSWGGTWADYDNDGDLDLYVVNEGSLEGTPNALYQNVGGGNFARVTEGLVEDPGSSLSSAWADYDNDGWMDLYVGNVSGPGFLYHNEGDGTFTRVEGEGISDASGTFLGVAWGDYDNDGWSDLFIANSGANLLFRNLGDGGFERILTGSPVTDSGQSTGAAWADVNRDGFLDLLVVSSDAKHFLYLNNGNENHWLTVRCLGTVSNRVGIGARVHVKTMMGGEERWQIRDITGGDGKGNGIPLEASFGLGTAASVSTLRIDWPSGIRQELSEVHGDQGLDVTEPELRMEPRFAAVLEGANAVYRVVGAIEEIESFQWYRDGVALEGETGSELSIAQVNGDNTGRYSVLISRGNAGELIEVSGLLELGIAPAFVVEPAPTTVSAEGSASFSVEISGNPAPQFQWQFNGVDLPGETSSVLSLADVGQENLGQYRVVVSNEFGTVTSTAALLSGVPFVAIQPSGHSSGLDGVPVPPPGFPGILSADLSVSLGVDVGASVVAMGLPPLQFEWLFNGEPLEGAEDPGLVIRDVDVNDAGEYRVRVSNVLGEVLSESIRLEVDTAFSRIVLSELVAVGGSNDGATWADYDGGGDLDLLQPQRQIPILPANNILFQNSGGGNFVRVTDLPFLNDGGPSTHGAWVDVDNNGHSDLYMVNFVGPNLLYLGQADGSYAVSATTELSGGTGSINFGSSWADFDNDGWLDVFVSSYSEDEPNFLLRNQGDGQFAAMSSEVAGDIALDASNSGGGAWADYDNDGDQDPMSGTSHSLARWDWQIGFIRT